MAGLRGDPDLPDSGLSGGGGEARPQGVARVGCPIEPGGPSAALDDPGDGVAGQALAESVSLGL